MDVNTLYLIDQKDGFSLEFSRLVSMMNFTRAITMEEVKNLSVQELDYLHSEDANSIGMLLAHLAALEKAYQIETFENRDVTQEEIDQLNPSLQLGNEAQERINGKDISYYLNELKTVREKTFERFRMLPDSWLYDQSPFWFDRPANNFFKWFHVFEDELNHRGQIRLIKKMYKSRNKVHV